jgi:hypothetical protein
MTDQIRAGLGLVRKLLALEPQRHPVLDLGGRGGLVPEPCDGPGVVLGLEEGVDELDLEAADGRCRGLQPEVGLEPVGQDGTVLSPPVRPGGLPGQVEER